MRLKVVLPTITLVDEETGKIIAEAENGLFCLEPRHVDFVAALVPGLLTYLAADGAERVLAIDAGTLVKCGAEVLVATPRAVPGTDLATLREAVERDFLHRDERQRVARSALARLESSVVRRLIELEGRVA